MRYDYYDSGKDGRLKSTTDAAGRTTTYDYDAAGNITAVTDNLGRTTLTGYDELGRPTRIAGPQYSDSTLGTIRPLTRYGYDTLGNLTKIEAGRTGSSGTNPASDTVTPQATLAYDDFGRTLKNTDALGKAWQYRYDLHNNIVQTTDPKGQVTTATWGAGHQLLSVKDATTGTPLIAYARNPLGQATAAQSPGVTYSYSYDTAHRLHTVNDSRGNKTLTYSYSPGGLLNAMGDSDGHNTSYLYDPAGRLTGLWAPNGDLVTFLRDAGGRLTEKWLQGGSAGGASRRYQYNPDNTLKQVLNRAPGGAILSQHDYTYDGIGNRQTHAEQIDGATKNWSYGYDALDRLVSASDGATAESYAYDPLNNRTQKTAGGATLAYVYDAANQLREIRQNSPTGTLLASLGYDANGNLTGKTEGATATTLGYDTLNRLTQVQKTGIATQSYQYDDQGRRIGKTVGATTTNYLYNGPDILGEYGTWTAAPAASYVHGPGTDDPLIRFTATAAQYYHQDGLGSVVTVSDASGAPSGSSRYDAWGNRIATSGTVPQYGYTGREPDETGLIYYRARYYDPAVGRFTQRDPIGLQGGLNLYAYVGNNPATLTDPLGLRPLDPATANLLANSASYAGNAGGLAAGQQTLASSVTSDNFQLAGGR
ncbi:MAG: RHS repeat-associated core domain-containing protein [Gammaproteobacteria bacterium]|nr:RHS repeat-associated core domain-containing protein [Gammaproteobacteria bacterium]